MASQSSSSSSSGTSPVEITSFIQGVHAYNDIWEPRIEEVLLLQRELHNDHDNQAVAVVNSGKIVGHVPKMLAPIFSSFLKRGYNKDIVQGKRLNHRAGHGLEAPCICCLYRPDAYLNHLKELLPDTVGGVSIPEEAQSQTF